MRDATDATGATDATDATDTSAATAATAATTAIAVIGTLLVLGAAVGPAVVPGVAPAAAGSSASQSTGLDCSYPITVTDGTGTQVTIEEEPQRIVTLAPSVAQTMWEFNASDKVVGVSSNADYLAGASEKEVVMEGLTVRTEVIVGLEPDVVLAPNVVSNETIANLRNSGLTVYNVNRTATFQSLYAKTERIGRLTGECEAAAATVEDMRARVNAIDAAVSDEERPGALYSFGGYTAGDNTFVDSILTTAGTENVAAEVGLEGFKPIEPEVVANNSETIEWLVLNSNPASHPSGPAYNATTAMQRNQTVVVDSNNLNQPAPRVVLALENITRAVHPEAYQEAQAALETTPTATATAEPTATTSDETATTGDETTTMQTGEQMGTGEPTGPDRPTTTDEPATTTTSGDGSGFTVVTGVLALLAAVLLVRRR